MREIHRTRYFLVNHEADTNIFNYSFFDESSEMTTEEYISELEALIEMVKKYKPQKMFGDMSKFQYSITPTTQKWIVENLFPVYQSVDFEKMAIILSEEFYAQLSIQQTMEEDNTESFETQYFNSEETAREWLFA